MVFFMYLKKKFNVFFKCPYMIERRQKLRTKNNEATTTCQAPTDGHAYFRQEFPKFILRNEKSINMLHKNGNGL